ncbi:hypothetical protein [Micromonospora sp. WMMC250]|uniref:hypothetical protein n=1 Tax=Micromonospora sp. WMMC250 TaxID=3014781 RepID=UPI0022B73FFF|nr:hypothetical protein [Micromonospora sp. WMMC250]MCZ7376544.1 hypothetical protein [Micromonospora sp. WMMC250]
MRARRGPERGQRLREVLRDPGRAWYVTRTAADVWHFVRDLGAGEYLDWDFSIPAGMPGGYPTPQLVYSRIGVAMATTDEDQVGPYTGSWITSFVSPTAGYGSRSTTGSISTTSLALVDGKLTSASVGRRMTIAGAGAGGVDLDTNIVAVGGPNTCTVSPAASTQVSSAQVTLWPSHRWSSTAGSTVTWTSPSGTTDVGIVVVLLTNGGLAKVAVDGDPTRATLLPTAQQVVDAGTYAASILTTNGGTLQPTDRVLNCYLNGSNYSESKLLATGLASGVHTVTVTATGYAPIVAGSANRTYVTGFAASQPGLVTPATPGALILTTSRVLTQQSALEAVYWWVPPGHPTGDFVGRLHGHEIQLSLTFALDGAPTTIPVGGVVTVPPGSRMVITQTTELRHPHVNAGATKIGDATIVYTLDGEGMTTDTTVTSLITAQLVSGYAAMLPLDPHYDRYTSSGLRGPVTSTSADDTQKGPARAWIGALWTSADRYAMSLELLYPGESTNYWARSAPGHMYVQDRSPSGGLRVNKIYASRIGSPATAEPITPGVVLRGGAVYRFRRIAGGAEQALAGI